MILYSSFLDELTKIAAAGYMLEQVGKPKLKPKTAMPPDPEYKVKQADIVIGPSDNGKLTSIGLFAGAGGTEDYEARSNRLAALLHEHRSLQAARKAYESEYPTDFTSVAAKYEPDVPAPGFLKNLVTLGKAKKSYTSFQDRAANPRIFLQTGPTGSPSQTELYNDVSHGEHNPAFLRKLGMFPTSTMKPPDQAMPIQSTPEHNLMKAQKVGTPDAPGGMKFKQLNLLKPPKSVAPPSGAPSAQAPNAPPAPTAKVAFDTSQFSGEIGGGVFFHPPYMPPFRVPDIYGKDPQLKESGSKDQPKTINEKKAAAAATPAGRLSQTRREGQPKTTGFAGPSISDVSKPVGFGRELPGTAKNRI